MKYDDMNDEQKAGIDSIIDAWMHQNVEVKTNDDGRRMFRIREDETKCRSHRRPFEMTNYGMLCRECNEGVQGIEWPVVESPQREPTEGKEPPTGNLGYGAGPESDTEGTATP